MVKLWGAAKLMVGLENDWGMGHGFFGGSWGL